MTLVYSQPPSQDPLPLQLVTFGPEPHPHSVHSVMREAFWYPSSPAGRSEISPLVCVRRPIGTCSRSKPWPSPTRAKHSPRARPSLHEGGSEHHPTVELSSPDGGNTSFDRGSLSGSHPFTSRAQPLLLITNAPAHHVPAEHFPDRKSRRDYTPTREPLRPRANLKERWHPSEWAILPTPPSTPRTQGPLLRPV